MAKSKARKNRDKLIQKGKNDPSILRGSWGILKPVTWSIPNKKKNKDCDYDQAYKVQATLYV